MNGVEYLFFNNRWAVTLPILNAMQNIVIRHSAGEKLSEVEIEARIGDRRNISDCDFGIKDGAAYIPIYGIISKRMNMINKISVGGGTSVEEIERDFKAALLDDSVKKIILDIDSPGGSTDGIIELSDFIYESRRKKPIVAYANGQMCSAAYWLGSAAEKICVGRDAFVGSIGVFAMTQDWTVANHMLGIRKEVIQAGKNKAAGHPDKPFTQDDRDVIQKEVNTIYTFFVEAVARNRGMSIEAALKVATGDMFIGEEAVKLGLADKVENILMLTSSAYSSARDKMAMGVKKPAAAVPAVSVQTSAQSATVIQSETQKPKEEVHEMTKVLSFEEQCKKDWETNLKIKREFRSLETYMAYTRGVATGRIKERIPFRKDLSSQSDDTNKSAFSIEQQCKMDWDNNPDIQKEFKTLETYIGFKRAEAAGRCKIIRGGVIKTIFGPKQAV